MVAHSGRETAIVPFDGSRTSFFGVVADEDDFVAVRKGAKPRTLGDMPLMPARTGNQNSRRDNRYAAFTGQDQSWCPDVSLRVEQPDPASCAGGEPETLVVAERGPLETRDLPGLETRDPNNSETPVVAERCLQPEMRDRLELETPVAAAGAQFLQRKKTKPRTEHEFKQVIKEAELAIDHVTISTHPDVAKPLIYTLDARANARVRTLARAAVLALGVVLVHVIIRQARL